MSVGRVAILRARLVDASVAQQIVRHEHIHGPVTDADVERIEKAARVEADRALPRLVAMLDGAVA